jgi:hypothetical protein
MGYHAFQIKFKFLSSTFNPHLCLLLFYVILLIISKKYYHLLNIYHVLGILQST